MSTPTEKDADTIKAYLREVGFTNFEEELLEWSKEQQLINSLRHMGITELEIFSSIFMAAMNGESLRELWRRVLLDEARRRNEAHGPGKGRRTYVKR
jgi:hypothetical protein